MTAASTTGRRSHDSGRARLPDRSETVERPDGVRIAFDVYGSGDPTIVMLPSAPIIHSRQWKAQVPFLSRSWRVVTYDGRGNGASDRPTSPEAYEVDRILGDLEAVMDATGTPRAVLVGLCGDGVMPSFALAAARPERVAGIVAIAVGLPFLTPPHPYRAAHSFTEPSEAYEGWGKVNMHYWRQDYPDFAAFFFGEMLPEPHSTKLLEDLVQWTVDGDAEAMTAEMLAEHVPPFPPDRDAVEAMAREIRCPLLLVHGTNDHCQPYARAVRLAELTGAPLVTVEGAGHIIPGRHPVLTNLLIRDFVRSLEVS
jgi:pimeloyl-ACP methyl ester carboxylesterase